MMTIEEAQAKQTTSRPAATPAAPMTIYKYLETVREIQKIIAADKPAPANAWQMVYAAGLEHKCGIPMDKSIVNFQSTDKVIEHHNLFSDWNAGRPPRLLGEAVSYFENLNKMNTRLDIMVSGVYKYNFNMSEEAIRTFEAAIDKQLKDLENTVNSSSEGTESADDEASEHAEGTHNATSEEPPVHAGARMGAPMVHEIVCDPLPKNANTTTYRWELECEKRQPIASTKFVWELSCDENRKVPHLLLEEIKKIRDQADAYRVNNYTSGDAFIANIKAFQQKLFGFAGVAYGYLNAPPFNPELASYAPRLAFVFENYMEQAYMYVMGLGARANSLMYAYMSSMTYSDFLTTLLKHQADRAIAHYLINYVCYNFKKSASAINTKTFNYESNTTIYFNGNTVKKENNANALQELKHFSQALTNNPQSKQVVPIWTPPFP